MKLINQPFNGQLGERLIELLDSEEYHTFKIIVAFAKNTGVLRIKESLEKFRERGGKIHIYVGIDLCGTSYEALTSLLNLSDSLNIVHTEKGQTFHSKIYQLLGEKKGMIIVGSHNLTAGGLWTNFESSVILPLEYSNIRDKKILAIMDNHINNLSLLNTSFMQINSQEDINKLFENGYVVKEVAQQIIRSKTVKQDEEHKKLFGNGIAAKLPQINESKKETNVDLYDITTRLVPTSIDEKEQAIWFETRKLTGGSRNILDLSKKSLIENGDPYGTFFDLNDPKFIRGSVEFFGLNPASTNEIKNITINFEGVDYKENTILFPEGEKANGTWRLQIKGVSDLGKKITDTFRDKEENHYLVNKIITFYKIFDDYYFMSVFPESELNKFKSASRVLARNGSTRTAKLFGVFKNE